MSEVGKARAARGIPKPLTILVAAAVLVLAGVLVAVLGIPRPLLVSVRYREVGGVLVGLGVPLFLFGLQGILPRIPRIHWASLVGLVLSVAGTALFAWNYPYNFNVWERDATLLVVSVYASGVVLLAGSVTVSVVEDYVRGRLDARQLVAKPGQASPEGSPLGPGVSDAEIARDLADASRRAWLWGPDVAGAASAKTFALRESAAAAVLGGNTTRFGNVVMLPSDAAGSAAERLRSAKGLGGRTVNDSTYRSGADALRALKQRQPALKPASRPATDDGTWWTRLARRFRAWWSGEQELRGDWNGKGT